MTAAPPQENTARTRFLPRLLARGRLIAWLVLILSLVFTLLSGRHAADGADREAELRFNAAAEDVRDAVRARMNTYEQVLRGGVALFAASVSVERHEWKSFVEATHLERRFPGVQGMGFARLVPAREREAHIRAIRAEGFPDYAIRPEGERAEYAPVVYLEPFAGRNLRAFGYDILSEAVRRVALESARDSGEARLSAKLVLVQETAGDSQDGFLMYLPVYRNGAPQATAAERRAALVGYVFAPFRMKDLMQGILGTRARHLDLEIYDGTEASPAALMYDDGWHAADPPRFVRELALETGGRTWTLRQASTPEFESQTDTAEPRLMLLGGLIISALLFLVVASLATLRRSEARAGNILQSALDAIVIMDGGGQIVEFNPSAVRVFGYARGEAVGKDLAQLIIPAALREAHRKGLARYLGTGTAQVLGRLLEMRALRADGSEFPVELTVVPVAGMYPPLFAGFVRDITERRRAEERLRLTQFSVDHAGVAILWVSPAGRILHANRAACALLGHSEQELLAMAVFDFSPSFPPEAWPAHWEEQKRRGTLTWDDAYPAGDGRTLAVEINANYLRFGDAEYSVAFIHDITARKQAEAELKRHAAEIELKNRLLEEADRHKSAFLARMSHELRTPLNAIIGFAELLRQAPPGDRAGEYAADIEASGREMLALVNAMLELAKIEAGKTELQLVPTDLGDIARDAVAARRGAAAHKRIALDLDAAETGECLLDPRKMRQMLDHLLSNAIKFTSEGGRVGVRVRRDGDDGLILEVSDSGIGIAAGDLPRLFEPFSQLDGSLSRKFGGVGLGLALVKRLAEEHGGTVAVTSEPGQGSTFSVRLPWRPGATGSGGKRSGQ